MPKKGRKQEKNQISIVIVLVAVIVITSGILIFKKPSITGYAVLTEEKTYEDNLNLVVNESKKVVWNLRNPGDLKTIKATGAISRNGTAKVYVEKDNEKVLIFDSTHILFDVNVQVLPDFKKIFQGEELLIQIVLFNLKGFGSSDVNVKYSIKDPNGNLVAAEEETVNVETQAKFVRKLLIPSDLKPGAYVAFVEVTTPDRLVGSSSDLFEVAARFEQKYPQQIRYYIFGIFGILVLFVAIILLLRLLDRLKKKKKIIEFEQKVPEEKAQKLEKELAALEGAFKSGLISKESYNKDQERIEKQLGMLRK